MTPPERVPGLNDESQCANHEPHEEHWWQEQIDEDDNGDPVLADRHCQGLTQEQAEALATEEAAALAAAEEPERAPVFPIEDVLNSASFWVGTIGDGAMELKIAATVQTQMGMMPHPNRPVTVMRFDADGWERFQEVVRTGRNAVAPKVQPVGAEALSQLDRRRALDKDALRRTR